MNISLAKGKHAIACRHHWHNCIDENLTNYVILQRLSFTECTGGGGGGGGGGFWPHPTYVLNNF